MYAGRIYADFQNLDDENRIRLDRVGTLRDLAGRKLIPGDRILLYTDDADDAGNADPLLAEGLVEFNKEETCWVARVDWETVRHASDKATSAQPELNGRAAASEQTTPTRVDHPVK